MPIQTHTDPARRVDPRLIEVATWHAHELRQRAIDDALRRLGRWLRQPFGTRSLDIPEEQTCRS